MKRIAPDYYRDFHCIADRCRHTCCRGWEIDVDEESLERFSAYPDILTEIETDGDTAHFRLKAGETCPFLDDSGLCRMILRYGDGMLCDICKDHPRFRNFFSDREEIGLGLACEEAARLVLSQKKPLTLVTLSDDGVEEELPEDEAWLLDFRDEKIAEVKETGALARFHEYLIYRHLPDALYDDRLDGRMAFIERSLAEVKEAFAETDGSFESLVEVVRDFSDRVEYDDDDDQKYGSPDLTE